MNFSTLKTFLNKKTAIIFFTLFVVGFISYSFGKQNGIVEYTLFENNDVFNCPYTVEGGIYTDYATYANEVMVVGKPELIENPELIRIDEPFDLDEFEKDLYKISTDKGWDERQFDVDGDGNEERIISANVAMTQTPHIALILKGNRVIFRAEGANLWIEKDNRGQGFTLNKTIDKEIGESETIRYLPKDGGFMPIWKQKACWVKFE